VTSKNALKEFDFNLIKIFDAVVSAGNAKRASQRLQVTPAAVTFAMQRLQDLYSEQLFIRTRQGLTPTVRAKEIHRVFSHVMTSIQSTLEMSERAHASHNITILGGEVSQEYYISQMHSMEAFERFSISHFHGRNYSSDKIKEFLLVGDIDLVVSTTSMADIDIETLKIDKFSKYTAICSSDNPLSEINSMNLYNFYSHLHAVYHSTLQTSNYNDELDVIHSNHLFTGVRKIGYRSDSLHGIVNVIENTSMIAVLPLKLAKFYQSKHNARISLVKLPAELAFKPVPIYASWHRQSEKAVYVKEFVSMIQTLASFRK
jgi:DNA-binding transcriptional LysR family regulator